MVVVATRPENPSDTDLGKIVWMNRSFLYYCSVRWTCLDKWGGLPHPDRRGDFSDAFDLVNVSMRSLFPVSERKIHTIIDAIDEERTEKISSIPLHQLDGRLDSGRRSWRQVFIRSEVRLTVDAQSLIDEKLVIYSMSRKTTTRRPAAGQVLWCNIASSLNPPEFVARHMSVVLAVQRHEHPSSGNRADGRSQRTSHQEEISVTCLPISSSTRLEYQNYRVFTIPRVGHYRNFYSGRHKDSFVVCDHPQTFDLRRFDPILVETEPAVFSLRPEDFAEVKTKFLDCLNFSKVRASS